LKTPIRIYSARSTLNFSQEIKWNQRKCQRFSLPSTANMRQGRNPQKNFLILPRYSRTSLGLMDRWKITFLSISEFVQILLTQLNRKSFDTNTTKYQLLLRMSKWDVQQPIPDGAIKCKPFIELIFHLIGASLILPVSTTTFGCRSFFLVTAAGYHFCAMTLLRVGPPRGATKLINPAEGQGIIPEWYGDAAGQTESPRKRIIWIIHLRSRPSAIIRPECQRVQLVP
jgi:hypothetical protein